jgi:hypothetical protein
MKEKKKVEAGHGPVQPIKSFVRAANIINAW